MVRKGKLGCEIRIFGNKNERRGIWYRIKKERITKANSDFVIFEDVNYFRVYFKFGKLYERCFTSFLLFFPS